MIADRGSANYKADVWSLGVLIHYLCSLTLPFTEKDEQKLTLKIRKADYEEIYEPDELRRLIRDLL